MKLNLQNTLEGFRLCSDEDYEEKRKLKLGGIYSADIKLVRNYPFLRKYFALLNCAWEYQNEAVQAHFKDSKDKFRESVQIAAGYTETFYSIDRKEWLEKAKSISFDNMKEEDFIELYEKVKTVLFAIFLKNVSEEEFTKNLINF